MAKERWASRVGLVLAMAGNAVGLGNFLRFPAQAAKNGGGAFLIPYIVALLVLGLPLIWVEWSMGRFGGQKGHHSPPGIFQSLSNNPFWKYFGIMGMWSCLVIAAFYLYIETWTMAYAGYALVGGFSGETAMSGGEFYGELTGERDYQFHAFSWWGMILFALCIGLNIYILSRGLAKGIEIVSKIGMPLLILFAGILAIRAMFITPDSDEEAIQPAFDGLNFIWEPRYDSLKDPSVWLAAAGQIFFTLSIGMGSIHCYSSYLRETDDVALTGATAAWTNEFCEVILGGTVLIPIAVAYLGLPEVVNRTSGGSGFSLGFMVFPTLFNKWGAFAPVAGFMWFGLLFFAAITSSLAMGQPIMAFLQQEYGLNRPKSALALGLLLLPLSLPVALMHSSTFFDEFDFWAGTFMLVVFAFGEAILFAWIFGMDLGWKEITNGAELAVPRIFYFVIKYVTPVFLLLILVAFAFQPQAGWNTYLEAWSGGKTGPAWEWSGDGMVGKLMHLDVASSRKSKLESFDQNRADLLLPPHERNSRIEEIGKLIAELQTKTELRDYEKDAKKLVLEGQQKALAKGGALTQAERDAEVAKLDDVRKQAEAYFDGLPMWRNIDRLVMVGVYAFFSILVFIAWKKRRPEGAVS